MSAAAVLGSVETVQLALVTIASGLQLTSFLFPQTTSVSDGDRFDVIIVGSGSAGSVITSRLTENPNLSVMTIEAGPDPPLESFLAGLFPLLAYSKYDWNYTSTYDGYTGQAHNGGVQGLTAGKMVGGSSGLHHLMYARGFPIDYDGWAEAVGDDSWNFENIYQYILKLEDLQDEDILDSPYKYNHGLHGNIGTTRQPNEANAKYLEALAEIGRKVVLDSVGTDLTFSEYLFMVADGIRQSTAYTYLRKLQDTRDNLNFMKETTVTKILIDENNVATGVTVVTSDGTELNLYANKEVIVSAGVFGSPQLLMLSGVGPKEELEKFDIPVVADLPVGQNLQDHVSAFLPFRTGDVGEVSTVTDPTLFPLPGVIGYEALNRTQAYPDYQLLSVIFKDQASWSQLCAQVFAYQDTICDEMYEASGGKEIFLMLPVLFHPASRGNVTLRSTDPTDTPIINIGLFSDDSDLEKFLLYIEDNLAIEESTYFKEVDAALITPTLENCADLEFRSTEYWKCYALNMASSLFHYVGTCSMGTVVDAELNVIGVSNLRVADASVIPKITCAHPEVPTIVLAEKVSDMIKRKYRSTIGC